MSAEQASPGEKMTKWTEGPWGLGERDGDFVYIDAPKHTGLARVVWQMEDDRLCGDPSPQQEANARLIAAAPDLYEALQKATAQIAVWRSNNGDMVGALANLETECRAALSKARGES